MTLPHLPEAGALRWPPAVIEAALGPLLTDERRARIEAVLDRRTDQVTVVIEEVSDPHNAAACVRTCEAFGLTEMHVIEGQAPSAAGARLHKGVMLPPARFRPSRRISQGADRWLDLHLGRDVGATLEALTARGYRCLAAAPEGEHTLGELDLSGKIALVFGSEHRGLGEQARRGCALAYRLPMVGMTGSLNLSVSVALSVYHAVVVAGPRPPLDDQHRARLRAAWYLAEIDRSEAVVEHYLTRQIRDATAVPSA
jgi:tRNA (guanosine-2'-O-)-methyltransferase